MGSQFHHWFDSNEAAFSSELLEWARGISDFEERKSEWQEAIFERKEMDDSGVARKKENK